MLNESRKFFLQRGLTEVDCPILSDSASIDAHIDLMTGLFHQKMIRYLHSSPEYGMKRLLSEGIGDIFQLSHVFRDSEHGDRHNPEFTLTEWYRVGFSFEKMIQETCEYIQLFLPERPIVSMTYRESFQIYANLDYRGMDCQALLKKIRELDIPMYPDLEKSDRDDLLNLILAEKVEPYLGRGNFTVLTHFPVSQAALAKTTQMNGEKSAERFEIYYEGKELANGYHELTDPKEQKQRFEQANEKRGQLGKEPLPIDFRFLQALELGIPDCCGVAAGFDRLMMLRHKTDRISDILPFDWNNS